MHLCTDSITRPMANKHLSCQISLFTGDSLSPLINQVTVVLGCEATTLSATSREEKMELLKTLSIDAKPENLLKAISKSDCDSDTLAVDDEVEKTSVPIGFILLTISHQLNTDQGGNQQYPSRHQNDTYHTADLWKASGLLNPGTDQYLSITGGGLYGNDVQWEAAAKRSRFKGRLLQDAQRKLLEYVGKEVDLVPYPPKRDRPSARMGVFQKWELPRTYENSRAQFERIENLIGAPEMGLGQALRSQQGETMRSYVRIQISTEHLRELTSQGARVASTTALNDLAKEDELDPGTLTLERVKSKVPWAWRRVKADLREVPSLGYTTPISCAAGAGAVVANQRALVGWAAQIVAENAAKKDSGSGDKGAQPGAEEIIIPQKKNANLRNALNQLKSKVDGLSVRVPGVRGPQFKTSYGGGSRGQFRGNGEQAKMEEDDSAGH